MGFWLAREQERLGIPDAALEALRTLMPAQPQHVFGAKLGEGRTVKDWSVILSIDVLERRFEGLWLTVPSA